MQSTQVHNEVGIWFLLGGNAECMLGENAILSYAHVCSHVLRHSEKKTKHNLKATGFEEITVVVRAA